MECEGKEKGRRSEQLRSEERMDVRIIFALVINYLFLNDRI